jgi:hypothetical protein
VKKVEVHPVGNAGARLLLSAPEEQLALHVQRKVMFEVACSDMVRIVGSQYMGHVGCVRPMARRLGLIRKQCVFLKVIHLHCAYNIARNAMYSV